MSIKYGILKGQFVWVVMFVVGMMAFWSTIQLSDSSSENLYAPVPSHAVPEECEMDNFNP